MILAITIAFLLPLAVKADDVRIESATNDAAVLPFEKLWTEAMQTFRTQHVASLLRKVQIDKEIVFAHTPEQELRLDLYRPPGQGDSPLPAVVWIHGGGLWELDKNYELIEWCAAHTAQAGFAVASIDYRLRGTAPLPAAIEDVKTAVRFLRAHAEEYGINPKAVAVAGESSGGYLAAFAAFAGADDGFDNKEWGSFSSAVSAAVIWYGHTMEEYDFLKYVSKGDPSVLLLHGERDMIVDIGDAHATRKACKAQGVPVELHLIEGADHGFYDVTANVERYAQHMKEALGKSVEFLEAHVKKNQ